MTENKTYNAADFERYHNGKMPANEMHALEKAALEDPFLADALEGYTYSSSVSGDLSELRSRLIEKGKRRNVFPLFSFKENGWWRIAALLVTIAGGSYLFFRVNYRNENSDNNLAKNQVKDSTQQRSSSSISTDTVKNNEVAFENEPAPKSKQTRKKILKPVKPAKENESLFSKINKEPSQSEVSPDNLGDKFYVDSLKNETAQNENDRQVSKTYLLKGKVTDIAGTPVPFATVKVKNRKKAVTADASGNFLLQSNDSSINATVSALGYASKDIRISKNDQPATIAVSKNSAELSAVVVTALGKRRKTDNGDFDNYLKENLTPLYDKNNVPLTGEVLLSFTVSKKGRPKNIKIIKSSCEACEDEAIKLLKNGPDWHKGKHLRNVLIKF